MTRRALGGLGSAVVLAVALLGFMPAPASAAAPVISWTSPGASVVGTVTVSGTVQKDDGRVESVNVSVSAADPGHPVPGNQTWPGDSASLGFSRQFTLPYNGYYTVTAEAVARRWPYAVNGPEQATSSRAFRVDTPPVTPASVKAVANQTRRTITLSWAPNQEPDLIGYGVYRKFADGSLDDGTFLTRDRTTYTHELGSEPAGTYQYQVLAARTDADGEPLASDPAQGSAKITSAPPTTTTTKPTSGGGTGTGTGGATTTTKAAATGGSPALATRGKADLSGFAALLPSGSTRLPAAARSATPEPDGSFEQDLPFGARAEGESGSAGDDAQNALGEESLASSSGDDRPTSLLFMASGLLVTVVLMHLLWLRDEVNREPLPAIEPTEDPSS